MRKTLTTLALCSLAAVGCNSDILGGSGDNQDGGLYDDAGRRINGDGACGAVRAGATLQKQPVDVIFVIDNSGSMAAEITSVQNNINANFATIIKNSGIDYRIIMISRHGLVNPDESICITAPLSGNQTCSTAAPITPAQPQNTANFFHYSTEISSYDSLNKIIATYDTPDEFNLAPTGWKTRLRAGAFKTFIEITDDDATDYTGASPQVRADNFDKALLAKDPAQFGTAAKRNYIFHSICGVIENTAGATVPWESTAPIQTMKCTTNGGDSVNSSQTYQYLSRTTGGLRYPICQFTNYDAVFKKVADGVVQGSKVSCDFTLPPAPMGKEFVLSTAQLAYTPGNGGPERIFKQVPDMAACNADSFYISGGHVYLCGTTCADVQADNSAKIEFLLECNLING